MALLFEAVLLLLALCALLEPARCRSHAPSVPPPPVGGLGPHLEIARRAASRVVFLEPGDRVAAGDVVQVSYAAAGHRFGVIVSLDGRGEVTLHHPRRLDDAPRVRARGVVPLSHAFELDDAPAFERFFFVAASDRTLHPAAVVDAAKRLASSGLVAMRSEPLPLPEGTAQSSFLLRKTP